MAYCINPESDEPIFCLWEPIGVDESQPLKAHVDGNQFARELLYMDGQDKKRIQIWINCEGGSIKDGFSICAAILKTKTKVDTLVIGIAYSMAAVIATMGRKREAIDYASLMFHLGYNPDGSEDKTLDVLNKGLITTISNRIGKSEEETLAILKAETFYTAQEAVDAGMIDCVVCSDEENKARAKDSQARKEIAQQYLNKVLQPKNDNMDKKAICKLLNLDENVTDAVALKALEDHIAKGDAATKALAKKTEDEDADKKKAESEDLRKRMAALEEAEKKKAESEEADKKAQASTAAKAKARTEITAKAAERNITEAKDIDRYVALAGETPEGLATVIEAIEAIQVTKKAPKIESLNKDMAGFKIPLIPAGEAVAQSPTGKAAGDTTSVVNAINSFDFDRDWLKRKRS